MHRVTGQIATIAALVAIHLSDEIKLLVREGAHNGLTGKMLLPGAESATVTHSYRS